MAEPIWNRVRPKQIDSADRFQLSQGFGFLKLHPFFCFLFPFHSAFHFLYGAIRCVFLARFRPKHTRWPLSPRACSLSRSWFLPIGFPSLRRQSHGCSEFFVDAASVSTPALPLRSPVLCPRCQAFSRTPGVARCRIRAFPALLSGEPVRSTSRSPPRPGIYDLFAQLPVRSSSPLLEPPFVVQPPPLSQLRLPPHIAAVDGAEADTHPPISPIR